MVLVVRLRMTGRHYEMWILTDDQVFADIFTVSVRAVTTADVSAVSVMLKDGPVVALEMIVWIVRLLMVQHELVLVLMLLHVADGRGRGVRADFRPIRAVFDGRRRVRHHVSTLRKADA